MISFKLIFGTKSVFLLTFCNLQNFDSNGLINRWHAITWSNDALVYWHITQVLVRWCLKCRKRYQRSHLPCWMASDGQKGGFKTLISKEISQNSSVSLSLSGCQDGRITVGTEMTKFGSPIYRTGTWSQCAVWFHDISLFIFNHH